MKGYIMKNLCKIILGMVLLLKYDVYATQGSDVTDMLAEHYRDNYALVERIINEFNLHAKENASDLPDSQIKVAFVGSGVGCEVDALKKLRPDWKIFVIEPEEEAIEKGKSLGYMDDSQRIICDTIENAQHQLSEEVDIVIWLYYVAGFEELSDCSTSALAIKNILKPGGAFYAHSDTNMLQYLIKHNKEENLFSSKLIFSSNNTNGDIDNGQYGEGMHMRLYALKKNS
jgi:hypothetical protein